MSSPNPDLRQDTLVKRKQLSRSDAVVGDDDNKTKPNPPSQEQKGSTTASVATSNSKDQCPTDMMGIDVLQFIEATLHKNAKDREFLLQIEEEFKKIISDESLQYYFFPEMTSYNRMLVHRVAAYFGFIHNVDQNGKKVAVTKQKGITKMPLVSFRSLIKHSNFTDKYPFARRSVQSFDESFGPSQRFPPSRNFRTRFNTASGEYGELNRGRRARSFEAGDYWNGGGAGIYLPQQFVGVGGEPMSSNCSSSASSSAIPAQIQSINLPLYQPMVPLIGNEAALLSPSNASAYSEPIHPYQPSLPIYYGLISGKADENAEIQQLTEKEEEEGEMAAGNPIEPKQQSHPHIPSLFSIQPTPQFYANQQPQQQQYYPLSQYQTTFYQYPVQPVILSPSPANTPTHYNPAATSFCYPNYYPVYQQPNPVPVMQPHPLLEENNTRYLANQLNQMNLNSETQQIGPHSAEEDNIITNDGIEQSSGNSAQTNNLPTGCPKKN